MGKKRLSPPRPLRDGSPDMLCGEATRSAQKQGKVKDGSALLQACKMDRSAKQYDHDGDVRFWTPPVFEKNFLFSVNEHGENRSIWVKTERGDCQ